MAPIVAIDARDALASELRGWGRYTRSLVSTLEAGAAAGAGLELDVLTNGGAGPEVLFEQLKLPWALRRSGAAIVHVPNCFLPVVRPCPGVVTVHDLSFEAWPADFAAVTRWKYRVLARLAARSAERVICPSSFTRDDLCERWGVDPAVVRVIAEAPALGIGGAEAEPGGPYVLGVGDLRRKKNFEALVRAFLSLRRADGIPHRLVLAGVDAGSAPGLRALAAGEPLELPGYVSDERLDALIRGAELLIHPSLYEGFGLVLLEAMVRGTPVLAARATALPETGGDAAAYFDPSEPDSLVSQLGRLLGDASARAEHSRRGLEWAARFSWERTARETAAVYRELL
jgi:glycosyltransferase involved in cell wall biosynthesis